MRLLHYHYFCFHIHSSSCSRFLRLLRSPPPPNTVKHLISAGPSSTVEPLYLSLLTRCSTLPHLLQVHAFMVPRGLDRHLSLLSPFLSAASSLRFTPYAYSLFLSLPLSSPSMAMLHRLSSSSSLSIAALFLFKRLLSLGFPPHPPSLFFVLRALLRLSPTFHPRFLLGATSQLHSLALSLGFFHSNPHLVAALIRSYSSLGYISNARQVFDGVIRVQNHSPALLLIWNAMLAAYAKAGDVHNAREVFDCMPQKDVVSWTTIISGYAHADLHAHSISIFRSMLLHNVEPDRISLLAALSACAHLGALHLGNWIHSYVDSRGLLNKFVPLNNALIDMYAKSGRVDKALQVFENMQHRTTITWTTMIAGLALHGLGKDALHLFSSMEMAGVKPNRITFIALLSACAHAGLVEVGRFYFSIMTSRYGIQPNLQHYGCMIHLLARAGYLFEAQLLLKEMPFLPNEAIWGSILAASNIHGDAKLGELALRHLIELEPHNSGNYSLLSNIYSLLGRWNESMVVRKAMRDTGVVKVPGWSFIEVDNGVHEFVAGGTAHPQSDRIFEVLCRMDDQLRIAEYLQTEWGCLVEFTEG